METCDLLWAVTACLVTKNVLGRWISHKCSRKLLLGSWALDILGDKTWLTVVTIFLKRTQVLLLLRRKEQTTPAQRNHPSSGFSWNSQERKRCLPGPWFGKTAARPEFQETRNFGPEATYESAEEKPSLTGRKICTSMKMESTHCPNETTFFFLK